MPKHIHLFRPHGWILLTSPADYEGWATFEEISQVGYVIL